MTEFTDPLTERFFSCIVEDLALARVSPAARDSLLSSQRIPKYIRQGDSQALQKTIQPYLIPPSSTESSETPTSPFPDVLNIFLATLSREERLKFGIIAAAAPTITVNQDSEGIGAAEEADGASERGNSNVNSSPLSSLGKDEFSCVNFQDNKGDEDDDDAKAAYSRSSPPPENSNTTTTTTPVSSFIGVSLTEAIGKYSNLGCPPKTPLLDFYRGITVRPFPGEGNLHVGDWYVNLPAADVDDLVLSDKIVSLIFPEVDKEDSCLLEPSIGTVSKAEMWWISKDSVAQSNIRELATCFFSALDIKIEWDDNKTTAIFISNHSSARTQEALESSSAVSIMVQVADFFEQASLMALAQATRELLSGSVIG